MLQHGPRRTAILPARIAAYELVGPVRVELTMVGTTDLQSAPMNRIGNVPEIGGQTRVTPILQTSDRSSGPWICTM